MNREIKFRAFSTIGKHRMIYLKNGSLSDLLETDTWKVMQFTGLRDRNGKEIYEGDKVIYTLNHDSSQKEIEADVEWHNHAWRLNRIWLLTEIRNIKVVGNVHEAVS
jgi:hypothetical protein